MLAERTAADMIQAVLPAVREVAYGILVCGDEANLVHHGAPQVPGELPIDEISFAAWL